MYAQDPICVKGVWFVCDRVCATVHDAHVCNCGVERTCADLLRIFVCVFVIARECAYV